MAGSEVGRKSVSKVKYQCLKCNKFYHKSCGERRGCIFVEDDKIVCCQVESFDRIESEVRKGSVNGSEINMLFIIDLLKAKDEMLQCKDELIDELKDKIRMLSDKIDTLSGSGKHVIPKKDANKSKKHPTLQRENRKTASATPVQLAKELQLPSDSQGIQSDATPTAGTDTGVVEPEADFKVVGHRRRKNAGNYGTNTSAAGFGGVERRAWMYVGRVKPEVTADVILDYLKNKCPEHGNEFTCEKLEAKGNNGSFKISANLGLKDTLLEANFWPEGVTYRRWHHQFFRSRRASEERNN